MAIIKLHQTGLKQIRTVDQRLMSYNVEMTEVTGGTFWKAYTPEQIAGTEPVPPLTSLADMVKLQEWYDPIDTKNERLINLAKAFGPVWVRVSGTWANTTYYNFDGKYEPGVVPEGFQNVLQKEQWLSLLDFVKAVDGKLLISFANCPGIHDLLGLPGRPGRFRIVDTGAVGKGDQQLAVHSLDKVQQMQPLILLQHILEAFGNHTGFVLAVEVVVGLVCPGTGNTNPDRAEGLGQIDESLVGGVDGIVPLLQIAHVCPVLDHRERLRAIYLGIGICLPECATGNFRHFHIIGHQPLVHSANLLQSCGIQFDRCHTISLLFLNYNYIIQKMPHPKESQTPIKCGIAI